VKTITQAEYERMLDTSVQRRCERSNAYRNAATAEDQQRAEQAITHAAITDLAARYTVASD
jgi:hypothetical protein